MTDRESQAASGSNPIEFNVPQQVIVLARSPAWIAAIKRSLPNAKFNWVLNAKQLQAASQVPLGGTIIVEWSPRFWSVDFAPLARIQNAPRENQGWQFIAVGDLPSQTAHQVLAECGVVCEIDSLGGANQLQSLVEKHCSAHLAQPISIETLVEFNLPW